VKTKGNLSPRLAEGSEITLSVDGDSAKVIKRGRYSSLVQPNSGELYTYEGVSLRVLSSSKRRDRGGLGTLTITLGDKDKTGGGGGGDDGKNTKYEVDYTLIEKPIEQHPLFRDIFNNPELATFRADIEVWRNLELKYISRKMQCQYPIQDDPDPFNEDHWHSFSGTYEIYCRKILAGIESYFLQVPVIRKTTVEASPPSSSSAGMRDTPPKTFGIHGKQWIKTVDRTLSTDRNGRWERQEEWSGFDNLDENLYPHHDPA